MYPYEKRWDAVMMVVAHGLSSKEAAAMLGYPSSSATLREWVREFRRTGGLHDRYGSGRTLPAGDLPETKVLFGRDWSSAALDGLAAEIDGYIEWYNRGRIKMSLGGMSPAGFRRSLGLAA